MLYNVKVTVCIEIRKTNKKECEDHVEVLSVKPGGT